MVSFNYLKMVTFKRQSPFRNAITKFHLILRMKNMLSGAMFENKKYSFHSWNSLCGCHSPTPSSYLLRTTSPTMLQTIVLGDKPLPENPFDASRSADEISKNLIRRVYYVHIQQANPKRWWRPTRILGINLAFYLTSAHTMLTPISSHTRHHNPHSIQAYDHKHTHTVQHSVSPVCDVIITSTRGDGPEIDINSIRNWLRTHMQRYEILASDLIHGERRVCIVTKYRVCVCYVNYSPPNIRSVIHNNNSRNSLSHRP